MDKNERNLLIVIISVIIIVVTVIIGLRILIKRTSAEPADDIVTRAEKARNELFETKEQEYKNLVRYLESLNHVK